MIERELDHAFVEHLRAIQLVGIRGGDEPSATYFASLVEEVHSAIHARGCSRADILRALRTAYRDPAQGDAWVELPSEATRPDVPSAKRIRWWPFT